MSSERVEALRSISSARSSAFPTKRFQNGRTVLPNRRAISYINSNFKNSNLNVDMICEQAGIGATSFRQLFKKHYQKTPWEYITDLRLEYARNRISNGTPIENVAYESGFNDPKYFARVVKKRLNCTPRDLKNYGR